MRRSIFVAAYVLSACALFAQADSPDALNSRLMRAYQAKDYSTFLVLSRQLLSISPNDPRALYNTASGEALAGTPAEAMRLLDKLMKMQVDLGAEKDPDFAELRKTAAWSPYADRLKAMRQPLVKSSVAFTLPETGLLASSVALDVVRGDAYVGSTRDRKIFKRSADGSVSEFLSEKDGLLGVSSLLLDQARDQLFIGSAAFPFMRNFKKEDDGKAALFVVDLKTGQMIRSALLSVPGEHHVLAELAEDQKGNIFAVDTGSSEIRRLRRSSAELELFISSVVFHSPRGLALSSDERTLYVLDGESGLWAVDVLSNDRVQVEPSEGVWIGGMSGLLRFDEEFLSLQAGYTPTRMVRLRLDEKRSKIVSLTSIESNNPAFDGPMPGNLAGSDLIFIANSQPGLVNREGHTVDAEKGRPTIVLQLPLRK